MKVTVHIYICVCEYVSVCVCVRERERESRGSGQWLSEGVCRKVRETQSRKQKSKKVRGTEINHYGNEKPGRKITVLS